MNNEWIIESIEELKKENKTDLYISILKRAIIIAKSMNLSDISIIGCSLDELQSQMNNLELIPMEKGKYEEMKKAYIKLQQITSIINN